MLILGIETSCDETAASVVQGGHILLSNSIASSVDLHASYGGVVPEIAARSHIEAILPVIKAALSTAKADWEDIDAIAVTVGPGLSGSLLIGALTAATLAIAKNKPLYPINHVEAHVYANFITSTGTHPPVSVPCPEFREHSLRDTALGAAVLSHRSTTTTPSAPRSRLISHQSLVNVKEWKLGDKSYFLPTAAPEFPLLALIVSGGHTQLILFTDHFNYKLLGQTTDDAVGEAFDKVAKILGLPYPGGPSVAEAAKEGDPSKVKLPKAKLESPYDFSFSGLKTAVLRAAQQMVGKDFTLPSSSLPALLSEKQKNDIAASFQKIAVETLIEALQKAEAEFQPKSVVIAGGVAANQLLREAGSDLGAVYTDMKLCTDNAAMIAALAYYKAQAKQPTTDPYSLDIDPSLQM